jgi:predicted RNA-binding protein Jag
MEITKKNRGDYFGYKDEETAIFIDENNYREKFNEFLSDPDNPRWERIAKAGREFALKNLNNDKAVSSLVELMSSMT